MIYAQLPTLPDSAESSLKMNQSIRVWMNQFENLPDHGNSFLIELNVILNITPIVEQISLIAGYKDS